LNFIVSIEQYWTFETHDSPVFKPDWRRWANDFYSDLNFELRLQISALECIIYHIPDENPPNDNDRLRLKTRCLMQLHRNILEYKRRNQRLRVMIITVASERRGSVQPKSKKPNSGSEHAHRYFAQSATNTCKALTSLISRSWYCHGLNLERI